MLEACHELFTLMLRSSHIFRLELRDGNQAESGLLLLFRLIVYAFGCLILVIEGHSRLLWLITAPDEKPGLFIRKSRLCGIGLGKGEEVRCFSRRKYLLLLLLIAAEEAHEG